MGSITDVTLEALGLVFSGDPAVWEIIGISFKTTTLALAIAVLPALGIAFALAHLNFPGRRLLVAVFNALLSVPAVVVGLTFYLLLSRQGPFGDLHLLFSQPAMVIGQIALSFPILVAMQHSAFQSVELRAWETARTLGLSRLSSFGLIMREAKFGLWGALLAAYGRIIAEVGASMMLGGNILHHTRNIPTAIALETRKGDFAQGIALGFVLLAMAFTLNALLHFFQGKGQQV
jgi:tungstate transport system permease protein